jgi:hypothetical protein
MGEKKEVRIISFFMFSRSEYELPNFIPESLITSALYRCFYFGFYIFWHASENIPQFYTYNRGYSTISFPKSCQNFNNIYVF